MIFELKENGAMRCEIAKEDFDTIRSYLEWRVYDLNRDVEESVGEEKALLHKHHKAIKAELMGFLKFESDCRQMPDEGSEEQTVKANRVC